jgi:hypothetical protein
MTPYAQAGQATRRLEINLNPYQDIETLNSRGQYTFKKGKELHQPKSLSGIETHQSRPPINLPSCHQPKSLSVIGKNFLEGDAYLQHL